MYLVSMDEPRKVWRREKGEIDLFSCMNVEPLDQVYARLRSRSRALSSQSLLALNLVHVKAYMQQKEESAHFLSLSLLLSLSALFSHGAALTHPLCVCMSLGYGGMKLLLLMYQFYLSLH